MKISIFFILFLLAIQLFAVAPLETGYALAPKPSASPEEKQKAYLEARNRVISSAMSYQNTPYRYGGMTAAGLDCSGFICISFKDGIGVTNLPRSASGLYAWAEKIPLDKMQPGDLIFFKTDSSGKITHVGLYLGNRRFIHAASVGAKTGVIINTLDEGNWTKNYGGSGRAFPAAPPGSIPDISKNRPKTNQPGSNPNPVITAPGKKDTPKTKDEKTGTSFFTGVAFAPTWNPFLKDDNVLRGFASQIRIGLDTSIFKQDMIIGLEARPEYDGALGVFRLPLTLSWGVTDKLRFFAGPALSIGNATITSGEYERKYSGGNSWFGTMGITAAPFIVNTDAGDFSLYAEAAWQSYFSDNNNFNKNADFSAGLRLSTGIRWTLNLTK